jgi:hypothetical protein
MYIPEERQIKIYDVISTVKILLGSFQKSGEVAALHTPYCIP